MYIFKESMFYLLVLILFGSVLIQLIKKNNSYKEGNWDKFVNTMTSVGNSVSSAFGGPTNCDDGGDKMKGSSDVNKCAGPQKGKAETECNAARERAKKGGTEAALNKLDINTDANKFVGRKVNEARSGYDKIADICKKFKGDEDVATNPDGTPKPPLQVKGNINISTPKQCKDLEPVVILPGASGVARDIVNLHVDSISKYLDELIAKLRAILNDLRNPQVKIGKIESSDPGTAPVFTLKGIEFKQVLDITVPQGFDGPQGLRGVEGVEKGGPDGPPGTKGNVGTWAFPEYHRNLM
jgi:hypothetical protein